VPPTKVNLAEKFGLFSEHWSPKVAGEVNDFHVKLVKLQGEFVWHRHDEEDELFLVVDGRLDIDFRDGTTILSPGEFVVVPAGVEHRPRAAEETQVLLLEPKTTINTGDAARSDRTVERLDTV
jgi:mannose-6-phosphate isomerase-like protein (cupin superfamily)